MHINYYKSLGLGPNLSHKTSSQGQDHSHIIRGSLRYVVRVRVRGTQPFKELGMWGVYIVGTLFWFAVRANVLIGTL